MSRAADPPRQEPGWRAGSPEFRWIVGIVLALFAGYQLAYFAIIVARGSFDAAGDSHHLWIWAKFLISHPAAAIYDQEQLRAFQVAHGMGVNDAYPFAYPPIMMILLAPFGLLPYPVAYGAAVGASLILYLWVTVGRDWRSPALFAAIVAPATTLTIVAGQTGFLSGALMIGGMRLAAQRPIWGGALLGLLAFKPQLGLLIPIALAAARLWSAMAAAVASILILGLLTSAMFGWNIWPTWVAAIHAYSDQFTTQASELRHFMPTVWANLLQIGFTPEMARLGQGIATIATAAVVWSCFRQGATPLAIATLLVGAFLATPYALVYDLPMMTTAVIWVVVERCRSGGVFRLGEVGLLVVALSFPTVMLAKESRVPVSVICLALLLGVIAHRIRETRRQRTAVG